MLIIATLIHAVFSGISTNNNIMFLAQPNTLVLKLIFCKLNRRGLL